MATIEVNHSQMAAVLKKLRTVENIALAMRPEIDDITGDLLEMAQEQPAKKQGAFTQYATPGQRRAYWAKVRSGAAQHGPGGYVRSGATRRGWRRLPTRATATRIQFGIENTAGHATFVQGERQQRFHRASNWITDRMIATQRQRQIVGGINGAIKRILR